MNRVAPAQKRIAPLPKKSSNRPSNRLTRRATPATAEGTHKRMARKKPRVSLAQPLQPRAGDLEKLFATGEDIEQASGLQLVAIRLEAIQPDPDQPRSSYSEEGLRELSESIRQDGVIQPIEVIQVGANQFRIVHGERRWRAAQMAGLATIPAVVRRRDYDEVTRFVRQLVENIQREDLNDVDRAAGLLRLRKLMQEELDAAEAADIASDEPWGSKVTWAKVGRRLGYTRQRIHQLIQLLNLPEEIKDAVRDGVLSERDTRVYQGLRASQQRALHRARMAGELDPAEVRQVGRLLKEAPDLTVHQAIRLLRQPPTANLPFNFAQGRPTSQSPNLRESDPATAAPGQTALRTGEEWQEGSIIPARVGAPTGIERLDYIRGHLARIHRQGLTAADRQEMLRLLRLIEKDVKSLIAALKNSE
jgi:ParB family chromosome partitioning protein